MSRRIESRRRVQLTFLVTDIEDSTALWAANAAAMERALARHDLLLHQAIESNGGTVFKGTGDGVFSVFANPIAAVAAAAQAQQALHDEPWPDDLAMSVRMAIDTGPAEERAGDYFGPAVNRVSRVMASGHGGQVLLTDTATSVTDAETIELGDYDYKGVGRVTVHQLIGDELGEFPELRTDRTPRHEPREGFATTIRGYDVIRVLGEGDFGVVYRAHQSTVGRDVAVKVIRPEYANQPSFIKRFEVEARFVAQLEHPHIVPLYDFWRDPEGAYLVMRLLRGGSLRQSLSRATWNPDAALGLLTQIGGALGYAHRSGVIHRDLKPENVLLDEEGNAYLTDFGIAVSRAAGAGGPTSTSQAYLSPEEVEGSRLSAQTDIFGLGVLTREVLTGVRPSPAAALPAPSGVNPALAPAVEAVVERATAPDPALRFDRVDDFLSALRAALGEEGPAAEEVVTVRNPYKGLRAFQETDQADFFGRDHLIEEVIGTLSTRPLTAVVGPSGSGKSSVVRAGVLPAVRRGALGADRDWLIATMFPGSYPFEELGAALLRVAVDRPSQLIDDLATDDLCLVRACKRIRPDDDSGLVLVIDQFEELFSLASRADRDRMLAALVALAADARSRTKVVITLRADYFAHPLDHPEFAKLMRSGLVTVAMPDEGELADAITRPAEAAGLDLEPGLAAAIVSDVAGQPGGLPLMQYTLTELVRNRDGRLLTMAAYHDAGGVLGALGKRAEDTYRGLDEQAREAGRQLFLRLVSVDEHSDDTRRRVTRTGLSGLGLDPAPLEEVIEGFGAHRLLTFDVDPVTREPTIEVAHEALIRQWPRLDRWIGEHREDLVLEQRLEDALIEWERAECEPSYLLRGTRLQQFETWSAGSEIRLTEAQRDFLASSIEARTAERAVEAARVAHERELEQRSRTRLRVLVAVMGAAAAIAAVLGFIANQQAIEADTQRVTAEEERDRSQELRVIAEEQQAILDQQVVAFEAADLAETAMKTTVEDPALAARLAQEAIVAAFDAGTDPGRAVAALHVALQDHRVQFPADVGDVARILAPEGIRGAFVVPLRTLFALADEAGVGVLSDDECRRFLEGPCPAEPPVARIGETELERSVVERATAFPGFPLENTDLRWGTTFLSRRRGVTADDWEPMSFGILPELNQFSLISGIDATGVEILGMGLGGIEEELGGLPSSGLADYAIVPAWQYTLLVDHLQHTEQSEDRRFYPVDVGEWLTEDTLAASEPPELTNGLRSDFGLGALWLNWQPWTVVYRTDVIANAGLDVPESWDELLAVSASLADAGQTPWCFGTAGQFSGAPVVNMVAAFLLGSAGPDVYDDWTHHRIPADAPEVVEAFMRLDELLFSEGHVDGGRAGAALRPHAHYRVDLVRSDPPGCAMTYAWLGLVNDQQENLGSFALPSTTGESGAVLVEGSVVMFNVDRPETRQLATHLTDPVFGTVLSAGTHGVVPNLALRNTPNDTYQAWSGQQADLVADAAASARFRAAPATGVESPSARTSLDAPPQDVLNAYFAAIDRWMEEGPDVLPEALAEVEAVWQRWEVENGD